MYFLELQRAKIDMGDRIEQNLERIAKQDHLARKKNLISEWVPESNNENTCELIHQIITQLIEDFPRQLIDKAIRIGPRSGTPRPILVSLVKQQARDDILRSNKALKRSPQFSKVWIIVDYNLVVKFQTQQVQHIVNLAAEADVEVKAKGSNIVYNGREYTQTDFHLLPNETNISRIKTRVENTFVAFQGEHAMLSNLHKCKVANRGQAFVSLEHAFQNRKCMFLNAPELAERVRATTCPYRAKRLGSQVNSTWLSKTYQNTDG